MATVTDNSSSPPKYTSTGGVESPHPSATPLPPPPYTEQPSYPVHATSQAIPAFLPNGATLPGCQAPPSGVDIHQYQTPLDFLRQMFYQGALIMLAWFACLCCFWPVGIMAVIKSNQVRYHLYCPRRVLAQTAKTQRDTLEVPAY